MSVMRDVGDTEGGHVLIEVIAALALLSIGCSALVDLLQQLKTQSQWLRERSEAGAYLVSVLEHQRLGQAGPVRLEKSRFQQLAVCQRSAAGELQLWLEWPLYRTHCDTPRQPLRARRMRPSTAVAAAQGQ